MSGPLRIQTPDAAPGLELAFEQSLLGVVQIDAQGRIVAANAAFAAPLDCAQDEMIGRELADFLGSDDARLRPLLDNGGRALVSGSSWSVRFSTRGGSVRKARVQFTQQGGVGIMFVLFVGESIVPALGQAEVWTSGQAQALELMAKGAPLSDVLDALCDVIEQRSPEPAVACFLLLEDDLRYLRPFAGRHLPESFRLTGDGFPIGPEGGVCGLAVARRELSISSDIDADARWSDPARALAAAHGFASGWAMPIISSGGEALGTIAVYYRHARTPEASELGLADVVSRTAAIAIERKRGEEGLRTHSERLRLLWETAAVLMTAEEPEALIRSLFVRIAPHLGLDVLLSHILNESSRQLELFSSAGVSAEVAGELSRLGLDSPYLGGAPTTHEPYGTTLERSGEARDLLERLGVRAYACFPLLAGERVLGTLVFASKRQASFEVDEIEFMRTVTRYLTVAFERLRLVKELREADKKKDNFMALLAHELRNPLAPLRNGLAIMRLSTEAAALGRARAIMERQVEHMVRLIDDLMDVSRISLNKLRLKVAEVLLDDIVAAAVETARPAIDAAQHEFTLELPQPPILLEADLTRLAQVFGNLLTNAAKYTPKGGHVSLRAERRAGEVVVTVSDDGIGLSAESIAMIFGMFSQVDHSLVRATGGLGIGLALVRGLTELHGGSVRAESEGAGRGSRFIVTLPTSSGGEKRASAPATKLEPSTSRRLRVLLAEDNRDAAESLATTLRLWGHDVELAHDGLDVVQRAEQGRPEVILMDIGMPYVDGYEAARRIRAREWGARPVIIALTGWGHDSARQSSQAAGCDEHMVKPVDVSQLLETMLRLTAARAGAAPSAAP